MWSDTRIQYLSLSQEISKTIYWVKARPWYRQFEFDNLSPLVSVPNPNQIKVATQSKNVGINLLVGYVGGYLRLILGIIKSVNIFVQ